MVMGEILIPLTRGMFARIDADDFERILTTEFRDGTVWEGRICDVSWNAYEDHKTFYARAGVLRKTLMLHRLILSARRQNLVDHRDGNGLNNLRSNLRLATHRQNSVNGRLRTTNTTGFRGVSPTASGRFMATIRDGSRGKKYLGIFATAEDAAHEYDMAASDIFGEFARLNFPLAETA
jgi:hypothetical protein